MKNIIKTAVIGTGYLGQYHAEKYALLPQAELVAVCDVDLQRCQEIATKYHTQAVTDYRSLLGKISAVSIVVPTLLHYEVAKFFLENGIHVLLEKPITTTIEEADELIRIARQNHCVLQIGHLERFNPVIKAAHSYLSSPLFIEARRLAPFKSRGADVDVVLDLMIHDIDLIQFLVKSNIKQIHANGLTMMTSNIDIANVRIEFTNGCIANLTANRVYPHIQRQLRIFQQDTYLDLDLDKKTLFFHSENPINLCFDKGDALRDQIDAFLKAIIQATPAIVNGEDGRNALATALEITTLINTSKIQDK